ncbi:MAG: protein jag [Clostridia bacterium]|nr:protein jag [Clostridia bacterium]
MIKEAIGVGATLEEATEKAKAELNASFDEEVQFEVLANPKKKTLGLFGGSLAKVRVFVEMPDPAPKKQRSPKKENKKNENKERREKHAPKAEAPIEKVETPAIPEEQIEKDSPTGRAIAYLRTILANLGAVEVKISACEIEKGSRIILEGENLGIVIGRRGETLDALQYLASLAANSGGDFFRITLDTGNYREKREGTLKSLARRVSNQVLRTGRSRALEPMNPYERRIIHTEVQTIEGVESNSIGEGKNRRVVISPVGGGKRDHYRRDDRRGGRRDRGAAKPVVDPDRAPKKDAVDLPLYGKID